MSFFKSFLASLVAIFVAFLLLFFVMMGIFAAALSGSKQQVVVSDNSILKISLSAPIVEHSPPNADDVNLDLSKFLPGAADTRTMGLYQIVDAINRAKDDDRIRGIYLTPGMDIQTGYASIRAIHNALKNFKESGKFIYTYSEVLTEKPYYLASVSNEICMTPGGIMEFNGFVTNRTFMAGLFEKLEIQPKIFKVGTFKSAVEPYIRKDMSEASRMQTEAYISVLWEEYLEDISAGRNMPVSQLDKIAGEFVMNDGNAAVKAGLIDRAIYENEMLNTLRQAMGQEEDSKLKFIKLSKYIKTPPAKRNTSRDKIAIIFAEGQIVSGESQSGNMGSETIVKALRQARKDKSVKAIVLRVNSPGGSKLASDVMAKEVKLAAEVKPVICSMGDVAASGGYYIAAPTDKIFADENTITGSIGIFGMWFTTRELFNNKLGITFDEVETHEHANMGNPNFPLTKVEEQMIQNQVNRGYGEFLTVVREGRPTFFPDSAAVDKVGQGRVWAGRTAKDKYLVDEIGGLDAAVAYAAEQANISEYRMKLLPRPKTSMEIFLEALEETKVRIENPLTSEIAELEHIRKMMGQQGVLALLPIDLNIK